MLHHGVGEQLSVRRVSVGRRSFASLTSLRTVYSTGKPEAEAGNEQ